MSYKALLFCPDEKTARTVTQVLTELDFQIEPSNEPFATVKRLTAEHFDALVVDCENEQNATLLFKSARNSELNQASLSIAVVEGQAGVAKAFRIGANLVLTKPINVEQSKGTIRVARGLLRKSEASRPAATSTRPEQPTQTSANSPRVTVSPPSSSIPSSFELENEPEPQPEPAEAALLESMPDPAADLGRLAASKHAQASPWQPLSKPMTARQPTAAESDERKELLELLASAGSASPISASSTGAAAAPAKQKPPVRQEVQDRGIELPSFASAMEKPRAAASAESGSRKKGMLIGAMLLITAAAGYVGWTRTHSGAPASSVQQPSPQAQIVQQPAVALAAAPTTSEPGPSDAAGMGTELSETVPQPKPVSSAVTKETAAPKPKKSAIASTDASSEEESDVTVVLPKAIVVKKADGNKPVSRLAATDQADASAPTALNIAQDSQPDNIAGLVNVSPTVPKAVPQTLKISQGVSQGLLVKKVAPVYPQQALQMKIQGSVEVAATISKAGNITNLKILSGDPILGRAALDAVKQWKYKPYYLDSQPVEIQTQITVVFKLP